ncbi:MAG: hypothetical protein HQL97_00690 [Magnetococcales bacterium]|nr:hypothetical protein [Magnetococcales bacterium]
MRHIPVEHPIQPPASQVGTQVDPWLHSLLAMSAVQRCLVATIPIALLWLGILWSVAQP